MVHLACFATPAAAGSHAAPEARKITHIGNLICASVHHRRAHTRTFRRCSPSCPGQHGTTRQCSCAVMGHWSSQASPPSIPDWCACQLSAKLPFCLPAGLPFTSRPTKSWRATKMKRNCSTPCTSAMRCVLKSYITARSMASARSTVLCGHVTVCKPAKLAGQGPYMILRLELSGSVWGPCSVLLQGSATGSG